MKKNQELQMKRDQVVNVRDWFMNLVIILLIIVISGMIRQQSILLTHVNSELKTMQIQLDKMEKPNSLPNITMPEIEVDSIPDPEPKVYYPITSEEYSIMAKVVWAEARGVSDRAHQAAVLWCILNRVDAGLGGDTIKKVATYPNAFAYYPDSPVTEDMMILTMDVFDRWSREMLGEKDVGRVLPSDYLYFTGDGKENHFTKTLERTNPWQWKLPSPYNKEGGSL